MSAFSPTVDPAERRLIELAVARLHDLAADVDRSAARVVVTPATSSWSGGARRRHEAAARRLEVELRAIAAMLRDVAEDAGTALATAVREAERHAALTLVASGGSRTTADRSPSPGGRSRPPTTGGASMDPFAPTGAGGTTRPSVPATVR